jgi:signal transduction histidine kinase
VLVGKAILAHRLDDTDRIALARAEATYARNTTFFARYTSRRALAEYDASNGRTTATGGLGAPMMQTVSTIVDTGAVPAGLTTEGWQATTSDFVTRVGPAVITSALDIDTDVRRLRDARQEQAVATAVVVGMLLVLTMLLGFAAARSITAPLRRLRDAALRLAESELPEQVRALERSGGSRTVAPRSAPFRHKRHDEIAEVASAFDAVHAQALRLAAEQATLRAHVNTMFVNLARRSRSLVERQLRLIDDLEAAESDPARLAHVYKLDRLATRLRRNDESLLVLAGARAAQATTEDSAVVDVMRAATAEVEQYDRVIVDTPETALVRGDLCIDLVHVLAELVENATVFSPPSTPVTVHTVARETGAPLVIQVTDVGPGMTPERLTEANARLHGPSELNADSARHMGLVVASRLAARRGWTVELRANWPHGIAATVTVPASALVRAVAAPPAATPAAPVSPVVATQPTSPPAAAGPAVQAPGRVPGVPAPARAADDDASPIFASLESGWSSPLTAPGWTPLDDAEWDRALLDDRTGRPAT